MSRPLVSISMLTLNALEYTQKAVVSVLRHTRSLELLITDNGSTDGTQRWLKRMSAEDPRITLTLNPTNEGFIRPHNRQARLALGEYICILNNDVEVSARWMDALLVGFRDPEVAQVGPFQDYGQLSQFMVGEKAPGGSTKEPEYIGGYCFVIPRAIYERYGLFDEVHLTWATAEDSDYSLRLRRFGWKIKAVPVPIKHYTEKTMTLGTEVLGYDRFQNEKRNQSVLRERWRDYIRYRKFDQYKILVLRWDAYGDVLCIEPALRALRWKYPRAHIEVITRCPEVLATCPYLDYMSGDVNRIKNVRWDEMYDLTNCYEKDPKTHIVEAYCRQVGVPASRPQFPLPKEALTFASRLQGNRPMISVCADGSWLARTWPLDRFKEVVAWLSQAFDILELGMKTQEYTGIGRDLLRKTRIDHLAAALYASELYFGMDGLLYHLAAAVETPSVVLWGCTSPEMRVHDGVRSYAVLREDLKCQGCHHRLPAPRNHTNCDNGKFAGLLVQKDACMDMPVEDVKDALRRAFVELGIEAGTAL